MAEANETIKEGLLRRMYGGVILVVEPYVTEFTMVTATGDNFLWEGQSQPAIQAVVRAHPDNSGRCWVNIREKPSPSDGWPLDANDWIKMTVLNMHHLRVLIETSGDKVIVARTS